MFLFRAILHWLNMYADLHTNLGLIVMVFHLLFLSSLDVSSFVLTPTNIPEALLVLCPVSDGAMKERGPLSEPDLFVCHLYTYARFTQRWRAEDPSCAVTVLFALVVSRFYTEGCG